MRALLISVLLVASCAPAPALAAGIPAEAQQHRRVLVRVAHQVMGLAAPVATLAAQVHQESRWRPDARSGAGAEGLAQTMPGTAAWLAEIQPRELHPAQPFNPGWALRALVTYDDWLLARVPGAGDCERWAFALAGYNGGLGWVQRDRRQARAAGADPDRWFGQVEHHTARADWARRENRGYVRRILTELEPRYRAAGWGQGACA